MTTDEAYRPRLSIEISSQQARELRALIPWGLKNQIFCTIIDDVVRLAKAHGPNFLAGILSRSIKLEEYSDIMKGVEDGNNPRP